MLANVRNKLALAISRMKGGFSDPTRMQFPTRERREFTQGLTTALGSVNDDPRRGPVRLKRLYLSYPATIPQGRRERLRRVKQIVLGRIPFAQLGLKRVNAWEEFQLATKNWNKMG